MEQQITHILQQTFQGMNVELYEMSNGRLSGTVIWERFDDQDMGERQNLIRTALRKGLGAQFSQVGVLLTYTPREMSSMKAA